MIVYMSVDERGIIDDLKSAVVHLVWDDRGVRTHSKVTLQSAYFRAPLNEAIKQENANKATEGRSEPQKIKVLHLWDIEKNKWLGIPIDRVIMAQLTAA